MQSKHQNFTSSRYSSLIGSQTPIREQQTGQTAEHRCKPNSLSDDHSELAPLLPIPNRTVKRLSADDSVDYPCESRSSSDSLQIENPQVKAWGFFIWFGILVMTYCNAVTTRATGACCGVG